MSKTSVTPLGDRILVEPKKQEEKSPSGIIIPGTASKEKPKEGTVLAVGTLDKVKDIKKGDHVLFSDYGFDEIKVNGISYYLIESKNVLAKVQ